MPQSFRMLSKSSAVRGALLASAAAIAFGVARHGLRAMRRAPRLSINAKPCNEEREEAKEAEPACIELAPELDDAPAVRLAQEASRASAASS